MRSFPYITVGKIILDINEEIKKKNKGKNKLGLLTRVTYYSLEKRLNLPPGKRTTSKTHWRVYSLSEFDIIKREIRKEYNLL
jgi:hypothetical protein